MAGQSTGGAEPAQLAATDTLLIGPWRNVDAESFPCRRSPKGQHPHADLEVVANELERAREALAADDVQSALVLLWNAVEPARLAGDHERLVEIADLARSIPTREAADLVRASGVEKTERPAGEGDTTAKATQRSRTLIRTLPWLLLVLGIAVVSAFREAGEVETSRPRPPARLFAPIVLEAPGLYLVPLPGSSEAELNAVVLDLVPHAGAVDVVPALRVRPTAYDSARSQFVAEAMIQRLTEDYRVLPGLRALVIGVTSYDMYEGARPRQPYTTLARSKDGLHVVVSMNRFPDAPGPRIDRLFDTLPDEVRRADL